MNLYLNNARICKQSMYKYCWLWNYIIIFCWCDHTGYRMFYWGQTMQPPEHIYISSHNNQEYILWLYWIASYHYEICYGRLFYLRQYHIKRSDHKKQSICDARSDYWFLQLNQTTCHTRFVKLFINNLTIFIP